MANHQDNYTSNFEGQDPAGDAGLSLFLNDGEYSYRPSGSDTTVYIPTVEKHSHDYANIVAAITRVLAAGGSPIITKLGAEFTYTSGDADTYKFVNVSGDNITEMTIDRNTGTVTSRNNFLTKPVEVEYSVASASDVASIVSTNGLPYVKVGAVIANLYKIETNKYTFRTTHIRVDDDINYLDVVDYIVDGATWTTVTKIVSGRDSGSAYLNTVASDTPFDTTGHSGMHSVLSVDNVPADGVYQVSVMLHITPKTASATKSDLVFQFTNGDGTGWPNHTFHAVVDDSQTFAQQLSFSTSVSLKAGQNTLRIQCGGLNTEYLVFVDELTVAQLVNGVYHNGDDFDEVHTLTEAADFNNDDGVLVDGATGGPRFMLWRTLANKVLGFIKSLSTTITAFRTGDYIAVDGPTGPAKMDSDSIFSSDGNISDRYNEAPYNDFDTFPINKVVYCSNNGHLIANSPSGTYGFSCITLNGFALSNSRIQICTDSNRKAWVRNRFNGIWSEWSKLDSSVYLAGNISNKYNSAPYNDFNTFPINEIVYCSNNGQNISNNPSGSYAFTCVTLSGEVGVSARIQICTDSDRNTFMRNCFTNVWTEWFSLNNKVTAMGDISGKISTAPYNDLNTFPMNEVCFIPSGASGVENKPNAEMSAFMISTFGGKYTSDYGTTRMQILHDASKNIFVRCSWGSTWSDWIQLKSSSGFVSAAGNINTINASAPYNDLNTFPMNEICFCSANGSRTANKPIEDSGFIVATFGGLFTSLNGTTRIQVFCSSTRRYFIRSCWGKTFGSWVEIKNNESSFVDVLNQFSNIICIGDSLTWSQVYTGANTSRQAKKTYPQILSLITQSSVTSYAVAGDNAQTSWNRWKDTFESLPNSVAIIYLGTNNGLTDTLSTDCPENDPYTSWADTNTGCYGKMIARLQELGYKIILIQPWMVGSSADLTTTQNVVAECATRFGCALVRAFKTTEFKYHYYPDGTGSNSLHYNDFGYSWFAYTLCSKINELDDSNIKNILPS